MAYISLEKLLTFWREAGPKRWFSKDDRFDDLCRQVFLPTYERAAAGELQTWQTTPDGALALVILLDQLPRNMFRGKPRAWATDAAALAVAQASMDHAFDREVDPALRRFFHMPFQHSENLEAQKQSLRLSEASSDVETIGWAKHHHDIVARFGRFPHRNAVLGRASTPEELDFLADIDFRG